MKVDTSIRIEVSEKSENAPATIASRPSPYLLYADMETNRSIKEKPAKHILRKRSSGVIDHQS